jgi:predicted nucleic acid-binding protein
MDSVYIESTIPSFLTARTSRNEELVKAQAYTKQWWNTRRHLYRVYSSTFTTREISRGDAEASALRLETVKDIKNLTITPEIEERGFEIGTALQLPAKSFLDAYHLATCIVHSVDYLLTWNCTHLANPALQKQLIEYCRFRDLHVPVICTPEELLRGI